MIERARPANRERKLIIVSDRRDVSLAMRPEVELEFDVRAPGVKVIFAEDLDAAQNIICKECPDLVVVDTSLFDRGLAGVELEHWLAARSGCQGLKVVWVRPD